MQFFARLDPTNLIFFSVLFPNQNSKYKISYAFTDSKKGWEALQNVNKKQCSHLVLQSVSEPMQ